MQIHTAAVLRHLQEAGEEGLRLTDLAELLGLSRKERRHLGELLDELQTSGQVRRTARRRFLLAEASATDAGGREGTPGEDRVVGVIRVHPAGYGFIVIDETVAAGGGSAPSRREDIFVAARHRGVALDGDRVEATTWMGVRGIEGHVTRVVLRGRGRLTGVVERRGHRYLLVPDDPRLPAGVRLEAGAGGARVGQAVCADIVQYPEVPDDPLVARVTEVIGAPDDPDTETRKVLLCANIDEAPPPEVAEAARRIPQAVRPEDFVDRVDLRDREFVTIDPGSARDFDDAVCVERRGDHWRLWVAIADVAAYVPAGSTIDNEARSRGTSVYLPDRAIHMLPEELAAGICSLKPEVDRLAMVVRLDLDPTGEVTDAVITAAVVRSRACLNYADVAAALVGDFRGGRVRYRDYLPHLKRMASLAALIRSRRATRGALDLDLPAPTVVLDEESGGVRDVCRAQPSPEIRAAYSMIEDFMVVANQAVGAFCTARGVDTLWRVHAVPAIERLEELSRVAAGFGFHLRPEEGLRPLALRRFLLEIRGRPMERALTYLLLRSLRQAVYDVINVGHFGLAVADYLHFTSPIRRYPDLVVHRVVKRVLRDEGLPAGGRIGSAPSRAVLASMASEATQAEQRAVMAEREIVDMYRALLMQDRVGEELDGVVTAVTNFGFFVEVAEPFVEGLVRLESLVPASRSQGRAAPGGSRVTDGPYEVDPDLPRLRSRTSGRVLTLGDRVRVRVASADVPRRRIELLLVAGRSTDAGQPPPRQRRRGGSKTPRRRR